MRKPLLITDNQGQGLVEYALIIALIVVVVIVAARTLGSNASKAMSRAAASLTV